MIILYILCPPLWILKKIIEVAVYDALKRYYIYKEKNGLNEF